MNETLARRAVLAAGLALAAVAATSATAAARSAAATSTAAATPARPAAGPRLVDLGTLPGDTTSTAYAINDHGVVVGTSGPPGATRGFVWRGGRMAELPGYGGSTSATDVDEAGDVVGYTSRPGESDVHAVLWHRGRMVALGDLGGDATYATGIDDDGTVVGVGYTATGNAHAFSWRAGVMTELAPGSGGSYADAVAAGRILGTADGQAVVWRHGVRRELSGFDPDVLADVNRRGDVLGGSPMSGSLVRWSNGRVTSIATPAGQDELALQALNDRREAAGYSDRWDENLEVSYHAWVWRHGALTGLPDLVGQSRALDVNEHGTVAGDSAVAATWRDTHAVVWVR